MKIKTFLMNFVHFPRLKILQIIKKKLGLIKTTNSTLSDRAGSPMYIRQDGWAGLIGSLFFAKKNLQF